MPSQNGGAAEQSDVATLKAKIEGIKAKAVTYHQAIESKTADTNEVAADIDTLSKGDIRTDAVLRVQWQSKINYKDSLTTELATANSKLET
jgi:hypothetical protein